MDKYSLENKIEVIEKSTSLGELPLDAMPFAQSNEYYFVSYSHLDYKEVYCDILRLQELGINIWYDRGLPAGRDWEKTAHEAIVRHSCIGVIFYLSKNSLQSEAVGKEINLVKELGKDFLSINLPLDGTTSESASSMIEKISKTNAIKYDNIKLIKETFNDNIIYIDYFSTPKFKADKIKLMKRLDLLNYEVVETISKRFVENRYRKYDLLEYANKMPNYGDAYAKIVSVNDIDITEITIPKTVEINGVELKVREIGECAFANCKYLQTIEFPPITSIKIGEKAFYACSSLKVVNLMYADEVGEYAFAECDNLEEVHIGGKIADNVFYGDKKLKRVNIYNFANFIGSGNFVSGQIEEYNTEDALDFHFENNILSFYSNFGWNNASLAICGNAIDGKLDVPRYIDEINPGAFENYQDLESITFATTLKKIGKKAFYKCSNLKEFNFIKREKVYTAKSLIFDESSFAYCTGLKNITIPKQVSQIKQMAFLCCTNIQEVNFEEESILQIIDQQAFDRCTSLKKINIPDSVEHIEINAFAECNELVEVNFSENSNLEHIHAEAFVFCKKLHKVTLPNSLKRISERAFYGCDKLTEIKYLGTVEEFNNIEIVKETKGKKTISLLDADTLEENIKVVCLDGETVFKKNEDLQTRLYDSTNHAFKNRNII